MTLSDQMPTRETQSKPASRGQRGLLMAVAATIALGFAALSSWSDRHLFVINASASLPNWAYWVDRMGRPVVGSHVAFLPPRNDLVTVHFGSTPPVFVKLVYGVSGDVVTRSGRSLFVSERLVGVAKPTSRTGMTLTAASGGAIPAGCVYAGTPHPDSFDSRYAEIGLVCGNRIVGTAKPIL